MDSKEVMAAVGLIICLIVLLMISVGGALLFLFAGNVLFSAGWSYDAKHVIAVLALVGFAFGFLAALKQTE